MAALSLPLAKAVAGSSSFPSLGSEKSGWLWLRGARPRPFSQTTFALLRQRGGESPSLSISRHDMAQKEVDLGRRRAEQLKEEIERTLKRSCPTENVIQCIDELQQLGIAYLFTERIGDLLDRAADSTVAKDEDLFQAALRFRVLRHNGYNVSPDLFHMFLERDGTFKDSLTGDWRGLLSLHEASHYGAHDEGILSHAMEFSSQYLKSPKSPLTAQQLAQIHHALELPRHMRVERFEAWRLIQESTCPNGSHPSPLLELASLDYNEVQAQHQEELKEVKRWWAELGLAHKLSFVRDRPQECFLWAAGIFPDPTLSICRIELAKTVTMLLLVDDLYDAYGSLEELTLFTDAIQRWDLEAMEELPEVMKICYQALNNTINEIGYKLFMNHGSCVTSHLRKTVVDLCEAFLIEAKWFSGGIVPSVEEYVKNGITSTGTHVAALHAFFLLGSPVSDESLRLVCSREGPFSHGGRILRLWNDLGTARMEQERGDVASSIQCYMQETGVADDGDARRHIRGLISAAWKDLNGAATAPSPLTFSAVNISFNLARTSQSIYRHGDDPRAASVDDIIKAFFVKPVK